MKYQVVCLMSTVILLAFGCSDSSTNSEKEKTDKAVQKEENAKRQGQAEETNKRWEADASTKRGIQKMQKRVKAFDTARELDAYKNLNEELTSDMDTLFKQCSMTGKGHKKLHEYLLPLKKDIQALGGSENKDSAKVKVGEIETYLQKFDRRFK